MQKRTGIQRLTAAYPVTTVCEVWGFPHSSTHYHRNRKSQDRKLREALEQMATEWPTYGSRRLTAQCRRHGWTANRKRIQRPKKGEKPRMTQGEHSFPRYSNLVQGLAIERTDLVGWLS